MDLVVFWIEYDGMCIIINFRDVFCRLVVVMIIEEFDGGGFCVGMIKYDDCVYVCDYSMYWGYICIVV